MPTDTSPPAIDLRDWSARPKIVPSEESTACGRILSAAPNITEICCALGLDDCLVGRTRYCTHPHRVQEVKSIGALNDLNVEVLLGLAPDWILVAGESRGIVDKLDQLDLAYRSFPDDTLDDLYTSIRSIGALFHRSQTAGALEAGIRKDLARVRMHYATVPRRRVLVLIAPLSDPPTQVFAAGPGSYLHDLIEMGGHENVVPAGNKPFGPVSLEFLLSADPEVVIELVPDGTRRDVATARATWAKIGPLQAVRDGRVYVLPDSAHFVLGPRIAQTFASLSETIAGNDDRSTRAKP